MASSSSDDEDEKKKFAEVAGIAAKDISNAFGKSKNSRSTSTTESLRTTEVVNEKESADGLTPEFKKHIAKKLSSYIESCIEEKSAHCNARWKKQKMSGIHLFKLSTEKISHVRENGLQIKTHKIQRKQIPSGSDSSDDDEALARFAEAAVCGQSIIDNGFAEFFNNADKDGSHNEKNKLDATDHKDFKKKRKNGKAQ